MPYLVVVDDDPSTLELMRDLAEDAGWRMRGLTHLAPLMPALEQRPPDLLILDDDLPDGRGGDLARELRTDHRLDGVPLLVCTAAHPMRQAEIGGWAPVVSKPFDITEIEAFLAAAATRASGGGSSRRAAG